MKSLFHKLLLGLSIVPFTVIANLSIAKGQDIPILTDDQFRGIAIRTCNAYNSGVTIPEINNFITNYLLQYSPYFVTMLQSSNNAEIILRSGYNLMDNSLYDPSFVPNISRNITISQASQVASYTTLFILNEVCQ